MIVRTWCGSYVDPRGRWHLWALGWARYLAHRYGARVALVVVLVAAVCLVW